MGLKFGPRATPVTPTFIKIFLEKFGVMIVQSV
jgi:hypothetical protein